MANPPPERPRPLHNFMLPDNLRWGRQKFLRSIKVNDVQKDLLDSGPSDSNQQLDVDTNDVQKDVHDKTRQDLRIATDLLNKKMFDDNDDDEDDNGFHFYTHKAADEEDDINSDGEEFVAKPHIWKLKDPISTIVTRSARLKEAATSSVDTNQRPKFSISLSREEIESDFMAMTGKKPPLRPKRRPKAVRRQLDPLFPGTWLTEVTSETYKVLDDPKAKKV